MIDPAEQLPRGTMVGSFRIEGLLGEGSSGRVYEGFDPVIEKRAAIKVLARSLATDAAGLERLGREARAANRVGEGAVEVLASGALEDGRPYLMMPLLEGRSLRAELDEAGSLPASRAWAIARQVAETLERAHAAGIVHRDLKPDNIFLERAPGRPERARVLDFGLAKLVGGQGAAGVARVTQSGTAVGTPAYMAPEQWFNAEIGPATDQYALGAVLYEMLAGGPPFRADRLQALLEDHLHRPPPALAGRGLPAGVEALLQRALAKTAGERFASMRLFIESGDAAFGEGGRGDARESARPEPAAPRRAARGLAAHAAILVGGLAALLAVGYTGPGRRDPLHWIWIAGYQAYLGLLLLAVAALVLPLAARRRSGPGVLGWTVCLLPAISGAMGTYTGWLAVMAKLERVPTTSRFAFASLGMYEANASRFMGFAISAVLCLALAAWLEGGALPAGSARRRDRAAGLLVLAVLAVSAALAGVPSGALISGAGALALLVLIASREGPELERGLAVMLALLFAAGAGFARIEAREGYLWDPDALPTRAARAAELTAAASERLTTTLIALAAAAVLLAVEGRRVVGLARAARARRPGRRTLALLLLLLGAVLTDAALYARMLRVRNHYREALASQFALLGRLEPPLAADLPAESFPPSDAPALQITREVVAVNAEPLARLNAVELGSRLRRQLTDVLAKDAVATGTAASRPDLLVTVDREVAFGTVSRILQVAAEAGVRRIELLLARSGPPPLGRRSPAEAEHLLPSDFVALRAELAPDGVEAGEAEAFATVAARLVASARAAPGRALRLSIKR